MSQQSHVPKRRGSRLLKLGQLAGGVAGGMVAEGLSQLAKGNRPKASELLLTPGNAKRLANRLSEMRGAAMKIGQLLSMEAGEILPREFVQMLDKLREDAHAMPLGEVAKVLNQNWGKDWKHQFERFNFTPMAAASIGQVHEALHKDGRRLAIKIQYPGIGQSIDSDVDNVIGLLNLFRLLPAELDLAPLLNEAKGQLHAEADYRKEAALIRGYTQQLGQSEEFSLPQVDDALTFEQVLTMSFVQGQPIESLLEQPAELRNRIAARLIHLALRELYDWGLVQTDPNFANYRYDPASDRIGLLDFGATRLYPAARVQALRELLKATVNDDRSAVQEAAVRVGYLAPGDGQMARQGIADLILTATEPARRDHPFDFGNSDLASRMRDKLIQLRGQQAFWRIPPPEILFLHRKLGGLYLLCGRLKAKVFVRPLLEPYL